MAKDIDLKRALAFELHNDPAIDDTGIAVAVCDGVATLTGRVASYAEWCAVRQAVRRVSGARWVVNDLVVSLPDGARRTDAEIAASCAVALRALPVRVTVRHGWVTLAGTVERPEQKTAASQAMRYLFGVVGVIDAIEARAPD